MNRSIVRYLVGRILLLVGMLMFLPIAVGLLYQERGQILFAYGSVAFACCFFSLLLVWKKPQNTRFYAKEGLVICSLSWILASLFGAIPLVLTHEYPNFIDAFFEISSGFTTTGATVATNIESFSKATLFWRSFTHLIGGMGVLVFVLALLPKSDPDNVYMMKAEMPGPSFGKILSGLKGTARMLYAIYLIMTLVLFVLLVIAKMPVFDAICHAMGTAGTGGFGIKNSSILWYNSSSINLILSVGMLVFGINFNLYYFLLLRKFKDFFQDEELHWYLGIVAIAFILICLNLWSVYKNKAQMAIDVFFSVSSIITTTGYSTADFAAWPLFSHIILLLLMMVGAMAGSTAGGLKVSRVTMFGKVLRAEMLHQREPARIIPIRFNRKTISSTLIRSLFGYFVAYAFVFITLLLIISFESPDFITAFSTVTATFNNIGPGLGAVGPTANYAWLSPYAKLVLSLGMITGRLEIWPVIILFSWRSWKKT